MGIPSPSPPTAGSAARLAVGACAAAPRCMPGAVVRSGGAHGAPYRRGAGAARGEAPLRGACSSARCSGPEMGPQFSLLPRPWLSASLWRVWCLTRPWERLAGFSLTSLRPHLWGDRPPVSLLALLRLPLGPLFIRVRSRLLPVEWGLHQLPQLVWGDWGAGTQTAPPVPSQGRSVWKGANTCRTVKGRPDAQEMGCSHPFLNVPFRDCSL